MNLIISCIINSMNWKKNFKTKLWTQIKAEKSTRLYFRLFWPTRSKTRQRFKGTKNGTRFSCTETSSISIVLYCSGLLVTIRILCSVLSERMNCNLFNNKWVLPHLPQNEGPTIINVQYKASAPIVSFVLSILYSQRCFILFRRFFNTIDPLIQNRCKFHFNKEKYWTRWKITNRSIAWKKVQQFFFLKQKWNVYHSKNLLTNTDWKMKQLLMYN